MTRQFPTFQQVALIQVLQLLQGRLLWHNVFRALSSIIYLVIRTSEIVNFFIRGACVVSHFTVAISAIYQTVKYAPFAVFFFGARRFVFEINFCTVSNVSRSIIGSLTSLNTAQFSLEFSYLVLFLNDLEYVLKLIISPQYSCWERIFEQLSYTICTDWSVSSFRLCSILLTANKP